MTEYSSYTYLYPPRPDKAIPKSFLGFYKKKGFWGQAKKNGTCNVMWVTGERDIITMNRHGEEHKAWSPTEKSSAVFKSIPGKGWYVFVTEVLHSKFEGRRDTHYVFDILVANGEDLIGKTFKERMEILFDVFDIDPEDSKYEETDTHYIINDNVWVAKIIKGKFLTHWTWMNDIAENAEKAPENEGLVLKDPKATLKVCSAKGNNNSMVKCRVKHKNYSF